MPTWVGGLSQRGYWATAKANNVGDMTTATQSLGVHPKHKLLEVAWAPDRRGVRRPPGACTQLLGTCTLGLSAWAPGMPWQPSA